MIRGNPLISECPLKTGFTVDVIRSDFMVICHISNDCHKNHRLKYGIRLLFAIKYNIFRDHDKCWKYDKQP